MNALEVFSSFEKAAELAKEPNSGCTLASTERHIALSPKYIGRLRTGVGEILDAELGRFSESLRGVLLAYGNVKLLQSSGAIVDDSPFIHFDVKLDAVVFKPKIGSLLKCIVNEQASDHVGCLVHDWFNVSLLASRKELNGQRRPRLEPGYVVLVQVQQLRALNGMLAIEARAPDDGSDLILEAVSLQGKDTDSESNVDSFPQPSASDTPDCPSIPTVTSGVEVTSEKKKNRKHLKQELGVAFHQPSVPDNPDGPSISPVTPGLESSSEKKKRRKHSKVKQELDVDSSQPSVAVTPDGQGVSTVASGLESSSEKKKRRKHSKVKQELDIDSNQLSVADTLDCPGISSVTSGLETSIEKKKKRKDLKVKQELEVDSSQPLVSDTPDGQGVSAVASGLESSSKKKKKRKHLEAKQELDVDSSQPSIADTPAGPDTSTVGSELETSIEKKKKRKDSKVTQELSEDSKQLSPCLETPISLQQTEDETSSPRKSKHKRMKTTVESNDFSTANGTAEGTAEAEASPKKKKRKRRHKTTDAADSYSKSPACNSGNELAQITAGEETSPKRKKKKKGCDTGTDLDSHQPPDIPAATELEKVESPAEYVVSDNQPLFSKLLPKDKSFTKLKKKKHRNKENDTIIDSSHQPLFSADPSSEMERTISKKLKKHKKTAKLETDEHVTPDSNGIFKTSTIREEPGKETGSFSQSALTPGPAAKDRDQKSHRKHKRKGAEHEGIEDSVGGSSKKKKKKREA